MHSEIQGGIEAPTFMMDHMVIRVGVYLRICGFDAVWVPGVRTQDLIRRANVEGRVFVTCNRHLDGHYPRARQRLILPAGDPVAQFWTVVREWRLDPVARLFKKCIRCNCWLEPVNDLAEVVGRVPEGVRQRHHRFWTCPLCGTIFWHGSHVANTCRKLGLPYPGAELRTESGADGPVS